MSSELITILKRKGIRNTRARMSMLKDFMQAEGSLDLDYFLRNPASRYERTTVFRVLQLFVKKKIIYRVPTSDGITRYLLQSKNSGAKQVDHSSFICSSCGKVTPLNTIIAPRLNLPKGYKKSVSEIVVGGLCAACSKKPKGRQY